MPLQYLTNIILNSENLLRVRLSTCPHCKTTGYIKLHGYLRGQQEDSITEQIIRGRRFFCSNRGNNHGCAKTFSILTSSLIKHYTITAKTFELFIKSILEGKSIHKVGHKCFKYFSNTYPYKIWSRFKKRQPTIRAILHKNKAPPLSIHNAPILQTIEHLLQLYPQPSIETFQNDNQISIL